MDPDTADLAVASAPDATNLEPKRILPMKLQVREDARRRFLRDEPYRSVSLVHRPPTGSVSTGPAAGVRLVSSMRDTPSRNEKVDLLS